MFSATPGFYAVLTVFLATGTVYWDASCRRLSQRTRLRWTGGVGLVSSCGFVLSFSVLDDIFIDAYLYMYGYPTVITTFTPYDIVMMSFAIGVVISVLAVLIYVVGSRFGPLKPQSISHHS